MRNANAELKGEPSACKVKKKYVHEHNETSVRTYRRIEI